MITDLKNEQHIAAQDSDRLLLSNVRVQYWTSNCYKSIRLENIYFIQYAERSNPRILYIALFITVVVMYLVKLANSDPGWETAIGFGLLTFMIGYLIYILSKHRDLAFCTSGGTIHINADKMSAEEVLAFIDKTEHAIHEVTRRVFSASMAGVSN